MEVLATLAAAATGLGLVVMAVVGVRAGRPARVAAAVVGFLAGLAVGLGPVAGGPLADLTGGPSAVTLRGTRLLLVGAPAAFFVLVACAAVLRTKPRAGLAWAALSVPAGLFIGLAEAGAYGAIYTRVMPPAASAMEGVLIALFVFPSLVARPVQGRRPHGGGDGNPSSADEGDAGTAAEGDGNHDGGD